MSVSVNYTSFTKTREGNKTLPGSRRRPHARFPPCPHSARPRPRASPRDWQRASGRCRGWETSEEGRDAWADVEGG